jgi:glycogen(starch) synthase
MPDGITIYDIRATPDGARTLKIAIVSPSFLPSVGGMEFVAHSLAVEWGKQGHEVLIINWITDEATHPEANYKVARFDTLRGTARVGFHRFPWSWYACRGIKRILRDFEPDFISAHMGYPTGYWMSTLRPRQDYTITCHGRDITLFDWGHRNEYGIDKELRLGLNRSIGAIAISTHARKMMEDLGVDPQVICDIPNGVDLERFRKQVQFDLRARLDLPEEAMIILSVGREHPQKAYAAGISAFSQVAQAEDNVYYVIVGDNTRVHQPLVDKLSLSERVRLCDVIQGDDLVGTYQQADLFFSPSIWEMMPLVVLEAMATGLPAVVTDISGSQDLVATGETGFVVEPGATTAMSDALLNLIRDDQLREQFRHTTLERANDYSWDRISRRYLEVRN